MADRAATLLSAWQDKLAELAFTCASATDDEAGELILAARDLLTAAPAEWGRRFAGLPDRAGLIRLIAAGGASSAALSLLEGRAGLLLSQAPGGCPMATVVFEGLTGEASAEGDSLSAALIGAMAAALAGPALKLEGSLATITPMAGARLN